MRKRPKNTFKPLAKAWGDFLDVQINPEKYVNLSKAERKGKTYEQIQELRKKKVNHENEL